VLSLLTALALAADPCPDSVDALPTDTSDERLRGAAVIVVDKRARRLMLFSGGDRKKTLSGRDACFRVALASNYVPGTKQQQGDLRTPEGWYRTSDRPWSRFYRALTIDYPDVEDAARGLAAGLVTRAQHDAIVEAQTANRLPPMNTRLGGQILIHGGGSSRDWTLGCIALDDADIDALRSALPPGMRTDVLVLPDSR